MNHSVSIIISIYNAENYLNRCVESILRQTYRNLEILLVDAGSTDNSPRLCEAYAQKDSRIKVIHRDKGGLPEAKNAGLKEISGDYVYFLDGNDYVADTLVEAALEKAEDTSADLVLFHYKKVDEFDNLLSTVRFQTAEAEEQDILELLMRPLLGSREGLELGNRLFNASLIRKKHLRFWSNEANFSEDRGFALAYALHASRISFLPEVLYYYRIRKGSNRAWSPKEPRLSEAVELCKLLKQRLMASYRNNSLHKKYSILLFGLMNEELAKLHLYNYKTTLSSVKDKWFLYSQIRWVIRKPGLLIKYYGFAWGMALLLQCIMISSKRTEKIGIHIIHLINKCQKISETYQYNKMKIGLKKRLFLIGCEDFWNLGDQHIAISELQYLKEYFPDYAIIEITASQYFAVNRLLPFVIRRRDLICMHGGGNIGNFYMLAEYIRRDLMKKFPTNEKVIFPQTIHYDASDRARAELYEDQSAIRRTKNLTLCLRERASYELAKRYFNCREILIPDIVLFSDYTDQFSFERKGALLLLRNDLEGVMSEQDKQLIRGVVQQYTSDIRMNDTQLIADIQVYDREEVVEEFISKIAKAEFVVTDRLHGMVFCAITRTPCIVLPNYNHKVAGVYEWISGLEYIIMIKNMGELKEALNKLRRMDGAVYDKTELLKRFDVLSKLLKSKISAP